MEKKKRSSKKPFNYVQVYNVLQRKTGLLLHDRIERKFKIRFFDPDKIQQPVEAFAYRQLQEAGFLRMHSQESRYDVWDLDRMLSPEEEEMEIERSQKCSTGKRK